MQLGDQAPQYDGRSPLRHTTCASLGNSEIAYPGKTLSNNIGQKQSQTETEFIELMASLDRLEKGLHNFVERLQPILSSAVPTGSNSLQDNPPEPQPNMCAAAEQIRGARRRVYDFSQLIESVLGRIEV